MGVKGFAKIFGEPTKTLKWEEFNGKTVGMDAMWELWQSTKAAIQTKLTDLSGNNTGYIIILTNKILKYISHGIIPVYIFDNKVVTPLKCEESATRKKSRNNAKDNYSKAKQEARNKAKLDILLESDEEKDLDKLRCAATSVDSSMIEKFQELLNYMGIAHFTAPPEIEGDKFCVELQNNGYIDYIYTADRGDIIAFGGSSVMSPSKKSAATYVNIVYAKDIFKHYKIKYDKFVDMCVAVGTDFAPKSAGIGEKTVFIKKITLSERQEEAKKYFMSKIPKKYKTHMYVHKKYSADNLKTFLYKLDFSISSINNIVIKLDRYYNI